ncbi:hypothetical protein [Amycolatopsis circi]|uniref:hypothetical protein n=1 Tax=Amycolatopsis circi TaxID=871959 RepID=UPI000E234DC0|nr:hypothetical protein [Amycolatopsis circi]
MTGPTNHISITGINSGPMVFGGTSHGDISGGTVNAGPAADAQLLDLLEQLRAQVREHGLPKQEIIEDALDELTDAARAPGTAAPAVPVSRWEKVKTLLTGLSDFSGLVLKISEQVGKVWPG